MCIFPISSYKPFSNSFVVDTSSFQTKVQTTRSCWSSISAWASKKWKAVLPSPLWKEFGSTKKRGYFARCKTVAIGVISFQVPIYRAVYRRYNSIYHWFYKPTLLGLKGFQFEGWSCQVWWWVHSIWVKFLDGRYMISFFLMQRHIKNNHIYVVGTPWYAAIGQCMTNRDGLEWKIKNQSFWSVFLERIMSASKLNIWRKVTSVNVAISCFLFGKGKASREKKN